MKSLKLIAFLFLVGLMLVFACEPDSCSPAKNSKLDCAAYSTMGKCLAKELEKCGDTGLQKSAVETVKKGVEDARKLLKCKSSEESDLSKGRAGSASISLSMVAMMFGLVAFALKN